MILLNAELLTIQAQEASDCILTVLGSRLNTLSRTVTAQGVREEVGLDGAICCLLFGMHPMLSRHIVVVLLFVLLQNRLK